MIMYNKEDYVKFKIQKEIAIYYFSHSLERLKKTIPTQRANADHLFAYLKKEGYKPFRRRYE